MVIATLALLWMAHDPETNVATTKHLWAWLGDSAVFLATWCTAWAADKAYPAGQASGRLVGGLLDLIWTVLAEFYRQSTP